MLVLDYSPIQVAHAPGWGYRRDIQERNYFKAYLISQWSFQSCSLKVQAWQLSASVLLIAAVATVTLCPVGALGGTCWFLLELGKTFCLCVTWSWALLSAVTSSLVKETCGLFLFYAFKCFVFFFNSPFWWDTCTFLGNILLLGGSEPIWRILTLTTEERSFSHLLV